MSAPYIEYINEYNNIPLEYEDEKITKPQPKQKTFSFKKKKDGKIYSRKKLIFFLIILFFLVIVAYLAHPQPPPP